jgi:hypothetical protein
VRVGTKDDGEPNLTIAARPDPGLSLKIVEGQQDPVQGWLPRGISTVRPAPVGIYTMRGVTTNMLYVLAPSPKGAKDPVKSVESINGDPQSTRITLSNGKVYQVHFHPGRVPDWN